MRNKVFYVLILCITVTAGLFSQGITATGNSITIYAELPEEEPVFYLIFSSSPLRDAGNNLLEEINLDGVSARNSRDLLVIKVHGVKQDGKNRFTYFFGRDTQAPWKNGSEFDWTQWSSFSPDIWDFLSIAYEPSGQNTGKSCRLTDVVIVRSRSDLLNTRKKESFANKKPIAVKVPDIDIYPRKKNLYPVVNLAKTIGRFKLGYYEISNTLLWDAYADLGQTDGLKYAPGGSSWCSEFSVFPFILNNLISPDAVTRDLGAGFFYDYFSRNGTIYTLREVAAWSNEKKEKFIKQGAVQCADGHTFIFVNWAHDGKGNLTGMQRISGNNGMDDISIVRNHAIRKIEYDPDWSLLSGSGLEEFDKANFFGIAEYSDAEIKNGEDFLDESMD